MAITVGLIGKGFVGGAAENFFKSGGFRVETYDVDPVKRTVDSLPELVRAVGNGILFAALPTPMKMNGECSLEVIEATFERLHEAAVEQQRRPIVVLKSTVPPGTTRKLQIRFPQLYLCYAPEFLTEANAEDDFRREEVILCGPREATGPVREAFKRSLPAKLVIEEERFEVGELVKYVRNVTLAVTVSLANEFYDLAQRLGVDYDTVCNLALLDKRLPQSHWQVPGPDGRRGFSGSCFPKDINALLACCADLQVEANVVAGAWATNLRVRPERDWQALIGRAVVAGSVP